MTELTIKGRCPSFIEKEEVKAIVLATMTVMAYHGYYLKRPQEGVIVNITQKYLGKNRLNPESSNWGVAWRGLGMFKISSKIRNKASFTTVLVHETIHLCASWGSSDEFIVSTLTDRLKLTIVEAAEALAANTQVRRAYFAHCKPGMSYHRDESEDSYNEEQWQKKATTSGIGKRGRS
jgi:hypothetical protein